MATTSDIKNGAVILHKNKRMKVVEFLHVKPGKGPAFVRTKLKDISSGKIIDETFNEIPSKGIANEMKQDWLKRIITMDKKILPSEIKKWDEEIYKRVISFQNNSIIFCHFMVINSILSNITKSDTILYFHPDYVSITKILIENSQVTSFQTPDSKKTYVNL